MFGLDAVVGTELITFGSHGLKLGALLGGMLDGLLGGLLDGWTVCLTVCLRICLLLLAESFFRRAHLA